MNDFTLLDIRKLDLNLATVFVALWRERSVTRAAERLALSQAAVSSALGRLRRTVHDPLFVRTRGQMTPTPRAQAIAPTLEAHLGALAACLRDEHRFDPAQSTRRFVIGASDDYELALGPDLLRRVRAAAPQVTITFRQTNRHLVERMLDARDIELGVVAGAPGARWIHAQRIGSSGYACLYDPRRVQAPTTLDTYLALPHVLISYSGQSGVVDEALRRIGRRRTLLASLTHFATVGAFLDDTAAIATLPSHAASALARGSALRSCAVPLELGRYDVHLALRRDAVADPGLIWLGEQLSASAAAVLGAAAEAMDEAVDETVDEAVDEAAAAPPPPRRA